MQVYGPLVLQAVNAPEYLVVNLSVSPFERPEHRDVRIEGSQGSTVRNVFFKNHGAESVDIILTGSNVAIDNIRLQNCRLVLDCLQNSILTRVLVRNELGDGVLITNATANCELRGTVKACAGSGIVIDHPEVRSILIHGTPIEENAKHQVEVRQCSKNGTIWVTGRVNALPGNLEPVALPWLRRAQVDVGNPKYLKRLMPGDSRWLDYRNHSGLDDVKFVFEVAENGA